MATHEVAQTVPVSSPDVESVAKLFHDTYERLAPQFGYETRKASAKPWEEVPENNRNLMIATVDAVLSLSEFWILHEELRGLAIELHRRHYPGTPNWKPSRTPRGLLSQIDNMAAGISGRLLKTQAALSWILPPYVNESTTELELKKRVQYATEDAARMEHAASCSGCGGQPPASRWYCPKCGRESGEMVDVPEHCPDCGHDGDWEPLAASVDTLPQGQDRNGLGAEQG